MSWRVVDHFTICREEGWCSEHPCVVRAPGGELLALWHRWPYPGCNNHAHPLSDLRASVSADEGVTWGPATFVAHDPQGGIKDFGAHTLPDGSIFLHASTTELVSRDKKNHAYEWTCLHMGKPLWIRSRDGGRTWSEIVRFPPLPEGLNEHPACHAGCCRSGLAVMGDGRLLMPSKATDNPDGSHPSFGMLRVSRDMGETWEYGGRIAEDPVAHFSEPAIHLTPGGKLLVLYRCHPRPNISSESPDLRLALVMSDDGGKTWSKWRQTSIRGCPAHMLGLRDNRIFVTVGTRWTGQRGCAVRVLEPEGGDMDTAPDLVVRGDSISTNCGYPWAVELNDGKVLVVYYFTYPDGVSGIEGSIVEEA